MNHSLMHIYAQKTLGFSACHDKIFKNFKNFCHAP